MKRVLILGSPGAGKSTFARELAARTELPLIHLDCLYWRPNWIEPSADEWHARLASVLLEDTWIIDGNYGSTVDVRLKRADTAIVLDLPRWRCLMRAVKRIVAGRGKVRPDMAPGCPERFDLEFLGYIWTFRKEHQPKLLEALADFDGETIVLRSPAYARSFLEERVGSGGRL